MYTRRASDGHGRRPVARLPDGLGRFFFPGVPEEAVTFYPTWIRPQGLTMATSAR